MWGQLHIFMLCWALSRAASMDKGATHVRMKVTELMTDAELITPTEEKIEEQGRQLTNANETDRYRGQFEEAKECKDTRKDCPAYRVCIGGVCSGGSHQQADEQSAECSPELWSDYDGVKCGPCSALVKIKPYKTCTAFCKAQNELHCHNARDDEHNGKCLHPSRTRSCNYEWKGTSDAICECAFEKKQENPFVILKENEECTPGTEITNAIRCKEAGHWSVELGLFTKRPVYRGNWQSVPFQCSSQITGDQTIHFNSYEQTNNKRLKSGEFVRICEKAPVHCEWNDWQLGECSKTCGGGTQINHRTKKTEEAYGGICEGEATIEDVCNTEVCPQIHCEWKDWAEGECTATCGTGTKTNTRVKLVEEANGGTCSDLFYEVVTCNPNPCPIDCLWDEWQIGPCDKSCGGGTRKDTRVPKVDLEHGGQECTGPWTVTESCNVEECPVHCEWNNWAIGECSVTCGGGIQTDSRQPLQKASLDGNPCEGEATRKIECNADACPVCFKVQLTTASYGNEISWSLGTCQSKTTYANNNEYSEQCCLVPGVYTLTCLDSYGDGWSGGIIKIQGQTHCKDFNSKGLTKELTIKTAVCNKDGTLNNGETGIDCGGGGCPDCGDYVLKPENQVCTSNEIIDNVDECELATSQLNLQFPYNLFSSNAYPKGCFQANGETYWNQLSSGSGSWDLVDPGNTNAICKAECCMTVKIASTGLNAQSSLGVYEYDGISNGKSSYKRNDGNRFISYATNGNWNVGDSKGAMSGYIYHNDCHENCPTLCNSWKTFAAFGDPWTVDPGLTLTCASSQELALEPYANKGKGYCAKGYYKGWKDDADWATMDAEKCANHCSEEPECLYFSVMPSNTCSRYNSKAWFDGDCRISGSRNTDYDLYKKTPVCNNNQAQDNEETGVDCGGGGCPGCPETVRLHFNETCCESKGVPEDCMGLCREKVESRSTQMVLPVDQCVEHEDAIKTCMIEEVHCEWNDWQLGECSKTCGDGTRINRRTKKTEEANSGICAGEATIEDVCNTQICPPIHCEWDKWVHGECSKTCGTGTRKNTRVKLVEEANGGTCTGQVSEIEECSTDPCPIDCEWDEWVVDICSKTCGGGLLTKTRTPKVDEAHGGQACTGDHVISESCNVQECPVDCVWNEWVTGECSKTCGHGIQTDTREELQPALNDGLACEGEATRQSECFIKDCPIVFHFNETCCVASGVPESCMGLCREKLPDRQIEVIMPMDQCAQYSDTVRSCLYSEGGESISGHAPQTRSFDEHSLGMPVSQMLVVGTINN